MKEPNALDRKLSARLSLPPHARLLRLAALIVAHSGDSVLWLLGAGIALTVGFLTQRPAWLGCGGRIVLGTLAAGTASGILKWLFHRPRPSPDCKSGLYSRFDRHAFPSGHAGRSACLVILLLPLLPAWALWPLAAWLGAVGLARVALQVHYVSDIVGGWLVGLAIGTALQIAL